MPMKGSPVSTNSRTKSRRKTPWDDTPQEQLTPTELYVKRTFLDRYQERHPSLSEAEEADLVNYYVPECCPYCGSMNFVRNGYNPYGIIRYKCECGKRFLPTTGTIFDSRKIPISEWIEYCLNIFRYVSFNAISWNNRNAISTSTYWTKKLFLTLENYQNPILLSKDVWLDETYYALMMRDRVQNPDGTFKRGLSSNQICIGVATDKVHTLCVCEGFGRPTKQRSFATFKDHIEPGSRLIHDMDQTHQLLIDKLGLKSIAYNSADLKGLPDSKNPLDPVNEIHFLLKRFLNAHSGFDREDIHDYLNLYSFVINPPEDHLEKVAIVLERAFKLPSRLRYRDQFKSSQDLEDF